MKQQQKRKENRHWKMNAQKQLEAFAIIVANHFNMPVSIIKNKSRQFDFVKVRHLYHALAYTMMVNHSIKQIAKQSDRDYASVIHSKKIVAQEFELRKEYYAILQELKKHGYQEIILLNKTRREYYA